MSERGGKAASSARAGLRSARLTLRPTAFSDADAGTCSQPGRPRGPSRERGRARWGRGSAELTAGRGPRGKGGAASATGAVVLPPALSFPDEKTNAIDGSAGFPTGRGHAGAHGWEGIVVLRIEQRGQVTYAHQASSVLPPPPEWDAVTWSASQGPAVIRVHGSAQDLFTTRLVLLLQL